eukprot:TRINITY_DN49_c0_g1_i2.p1 TRINITY_DN49_c0_g1~~TRINITY_DN49_c0_g1_i2.p1  ORF type:complete len:221 (-),score=33.26 TRINITY_DN49_c0_g1_i2:249-911(-)
MISGSQVCDDCLYHLVRSLLGTYHKLVLRRVCQDMCRVATAEIRSWRLNPEMDPLRSQFTRLPLIFPAIERIEQTRSTTQRQVQTLGDDAVKAILCWPRLRQLDLSSTDITDEQLSTLAVALPRLQVLDLSDCPLITDKGVEYLAKNCRTISRLSLAGCSDHVSDAGVEALVGILFLLSSSKQLRYLDISGCNLNHFSYNIAQQLCVDCSLLCQMVKSYG